MHLDKSIRLAFPFHFSETLGIGGTLHFGITIEEFFAAQAPDNIPDWFIHSMEEYGPRPVRAFNPHAHFSTNPLFVRHWSDEENEWADIPENISSDVLQKQKEIILAYYDHWHQTNNAADQWEKQNILERYFQWRAFYGVTMAGMKLGLPGSSYGLVANALKSETKESDSLPLPPWAYSNPSPDDDHE